MLYPTTKLIAAALEDRGLKYHTEEDESSNVITVGFNGEKVSNIRVKCIVHDNINSVAVRLFELVRVPEEKREVVLKALNTFHTKYRFVKFVLDDDNDVNILYDLASSVCAECVGACCCEMIIRFVRIAEDVYSELMKALWV